MVKNVAFVGRASEKSRHVRVVAPCQDSSVLAVEGQKIAWPKHASAIRRELPSSRLRSTTFDRICELFRPSPQQTCSK
jgi:hypothetical protein